MRNNYPKIGLALGSGGAKGIAHIGVLKSLEKHNIPINYIAGSSIGAIIGAHYALYQDSKKLEELVLSLTRKKGLELFDFTVRGGLIKGQKTETFLAEILQNAQFNDLKLPFAVVATDFNSAEQVVFKSGNLIKAIRASIAVPAVYQPLFYLNKILADGGLSNPVPVTISQEMGADITIAVNLDKIFIENQIVSLPPLIRVPMHAITILRHNLALNAVSKADIIISPHNKLRVGLIGWNNLFNKERALQIIKEGEKATDKIIPEIEEKIMTYQKKHSTVHKFLSLFKN